MRCIGFRRLQLAIISVVVLLAPATARADWSVIENRWYSLSLGGAACGFAHGVIEKGIDTPGEKNGDLLRTTTQTRLKLGRGATMVAIEIESSFVETARGEPVSATMRHATGGPENRTTYAFVRDGSAWAVDVVEGGKSRREKLSSDEWLTPQSVERFVLERLKASAKEITYRSLDLEGGLRVASTTMTKSGDETTVLTTGTEHREIPVSVWAVRNDIMPVPSTERYSTDGELVENVTKLGIGEIVSRLVDEKTAKAAFAGSSVEVLVRSFVPAKRRISGARERDRLVFSVKTLEGELPELPSAGAQRVRRVGPGELEVEVDARRGSDATKADFEDSKYRASSALIDSDSKEVRDLLAKVGPRDPNEEVRVRADDLRRFVGNWITNKNLASAFASASEAARSRGGDCSEHGVLLAALLRADGIPSRIASGLVYADEFGGQKNVWGWHVWTQACIEKRGGGYEWLDVDATLPTRFDAAHVLTGVSELAGGATDPMWTASLGLIGNISIDVTEGDTQHSSEPRARPAKAR